MGVSGGDRTSCVRPPLIILIYCLNTHVPNYASPYSVEYLIADLHTCTVTDLPVLVQTICCSCACFSVAAWLLVDAVVVVAMVVVTDDVVVVVTLSGVVPHSARNDVLFKAEK